MQEFILTIHILAATLWIGGMLFIVFILSPYIRSLSDSTQAFQKIGKRFSLVGTFIALPVLLITGLLNMNNLGISFFDLINKTSIYTSTLQYKLQLFVVTVIFALLHDLYLGPNSSLSDRFRILTKVFGIINLVIGILIIYLAAKLRFGG